MTPIQAFSILEQSGGLPENLVVEGNLDLADCISLESLPKNLTVEGHLDLTDCISLESLPEDIVVKGHINLTGCSSLSSGWPSESLPV